jgi:ribosome assembly protein YihI (activator of Der GTPase)
MLKTKHFFPFIKMVKALDIKDELKAMYQKSKGKTEEELEKMDKDEGLDYLFMFIEKLPNGEKEVMSFLSVYLEKSIKEVEEIPLDEMVSIISGIFQDPKFKIFFQQAVK